MIGRTVGPYRIDAPLGEGGMGVVYRGTDTRLGRAVALKFLRADVASEPEFMDRFRHEAQAIASLNHPGICTLHDIGEHEGQSYLVMELLDGTTLHERIGGRPRPVDEIVAVGLDLADALGAAHRSGVVHRDLKPANVIITSRGHAKILDFGVATLAQELAGATGVAAPRFTDSGMAVGTLAYMAPEQLRGELADQRADLYALGLVLYEMSAGRAAFTGIVSGVTLEALLNRAPAPLRSVNPAVPSRLADLIARLVERDPEARYQHADDVRAEFKRFQRDTGQVVAPPTDRPRPAARPAEVPSIAVLPFADLSPAKDQQYFCEGMADEITTALSNLGDIHVASRTSAVRCRERGMDIAEIGQRLNVDSVLDGSVRKAGKRLRISVQLTKVLDGYQLWAERYDRDLDDVFAVQDEIARAIADRLRVKLTIGSDEPAVDRGTDNLDAYNLYLQGRYHWARRNRWRFRMALESFMKAAALDANYAHPHAGVADCYSVMAAHLLQPPAKVRAAGAAAAARAVQLGPRLAEAHHALGGVRMFLENDAQGTEASLRTALELNPNLTISHAYLGALMSNTGRFAEAIDCIDRALALEPDSAQIAFLASATFHSARAYQRGEELARRALQLEPDATFAHWMHANNLLGLGRVDEAVRTAERGAERGERQPLLLVALGQAYAAAGRVADVEAVIAEMTTRSAQEYIAPSCFLDVYAALGRKDEACHWLQKAFDEGTPLLTRVGVSPEYDKVRDDPRFGEVLSRMGLPTA